MWDDFWRALCLMLILEGVLPFLSPASLRAHLLQLTRMPDRSIRLVGLSCMIVGVVLLYLLK